jgi:SAM-dependent MidA family methyltransferase
MPEQANECNSQKDSVLFDLIVNEIEEGNGFISFERYMELSLYHSNLGYYTRESHRVGKAGDFITSVSIGKCYGTILAHYFSSLIELQFSKEKQIVIVEFGAEYGDLAIDIMSELKNILNDEQFQNLKYLVVEPFDSKRRKLKNRLVNEELNNIKVIADLNEQNNLNGFVLGNEVLDAMPFKRVRFRNKKWVELGVGLEKSDKSLSLIEVENGIQCELLSAWALDASNELPEGFTTEVNLRLNKFIESIYSSFSKVSGLFIDYGSTTDELIASNRLGGTVRGYSDHKYITDLLASPGTHDITANVNFDDFRLMAQRAGFEVIGPIEQYRFLTNAAKNWLIDIEKSQMQRADKEQIINQFKMLIHPTTMGRSFKMLEIQK